MPVETVHLNADIITLKGSFYPGADFAQATSQAKAKQGYFCLARPGRFLKAWPRLSSAKQVIICLNCSATNSSNDYLEVSLSPRFYPSRCKNSNSANTSLEMRRQRKSESDSLVHVFLGRTHRLVHASHLRTCIGSMKIILRNYWYPIK